MLYLEICKKNCPMNFGFVLPTFFLILRELTRIFYTRKAKFILVLMLVLHFLPIRVHFCLSVCHIGLNSCTHIYIWKYLYLLLSHTVRWDFFFTIFHLIRCFKTRYSCTNVVCKPTYHKIWIKSKCQISNICDKSKRTNKL